jgi:hypothetical protein
MCVLYRLDFASGKSYVGQTLRKLHVRINAHRTAANRGSMLPVHCAWRRYGEPEITVVGTFQSADDLHKAEIALIAELGTCAPNGYNVSLGGDTAPSKNPAVAAKIAEAAKGRKHKDTSVWAASTAKQWEDPEYRAKVMSGLKASWNDKKREEISIRSKAMWAKRKAEGWVVSESTREKMRNKIISDESRAKMSASAKNRIRGRNSPQHIENTRTAVKGHWSKLTDEQRAARGDAIRQGQSKEKLSERAKQRWQNPEYRAKVAAAKLAARLKKTASE